MGESKQELFDRVERAYLAAHSGEEPGLSKFWPWVIANMTEEARLLGITMLPNGDIKQHA